MCVSVFSPPKEFEPVRVHLSKYIKQWGKTLLKYITDIIGGESRLSQTAAWGVEGAGRVYRWVPCPVKPVQRVGKLGEVGGEQQQQKASSSKLTDRHFLVEKGLDQKQVRVRTEGMICNKYRIYSFQGKMLP